MYSFYRHHQRGADSALRSELAELLDHIMLRGVKSNTNKAPDFKGIWTSVNIS